jgi:hypothetical protein
MLVWDGHGSEGIRAGIGWLEAAAAGGNIDAVCMLIDLYSRGLGKVEIDHDRAQRWTKKAREICPPRLSISFGDNFPGDFEASSPRLQTFFDRIEDELELKKVGTSFSRGWDGSVSWFSVATEDPDRIFLLVEPLFSTVLLQNCLATKYYGPPIVGVREPEVIRIMPPLLSAEGSPRRAMSANGSASATRPCFVRFHAKLPTGIEAVPVSRDSGSDSTSSVAPR